MDVPEAFASPSGPRGDVTPSAIATDEQSTDEVAAVGASSIPDYAVRREVEAELAQDAALGAFEHLVSEHAFVLHHQIFRRVEHAHARVEHVEVRLECEQVTDVQLDLDDHREAASEREAAGTAATDE